MPDLRFKRLVISLGISTLLTAGIVASVKAQWPTTCVELNDIVEAHLGNHSNVGIYQRTFGNQAEAACQNDHRNDVRSVFAWAISGETATPTHKPVATPVPTQAPTVAPAPTPQSAPIAQATVENSLYNQIVEITVLEFRRGAGAQQLVRDGIIGTILSPAQGEEFVAARVRVRFISGGPPGVQLLVKFTNFQFIDSKGQEGGLAYVDSAYRLGGVVARGKAMEGWLAEIINQGEQVKLRYRHGFSDPYTYFNLP